MDDRTAPRPDPAAQRFAAGLAAHQAHRLDEAVACYRDVLTIDACHVAALHLLGVVTRQQGDPAGALGWLEQAARISPEVPAVQASLAEVYLALGRHDEAIQAARTALAHGPADPVVTCVLGLALKGTGQREEAVAAFQSAIAAQPGYAAAHAHLGDVLRLLGRFDESRAACYQALRLDPTQGQPHLHLGLMAVRDNRFDEAGRFLIRATELEPDRVDFWEALAQFYGWIQQYHLALPCWERVHALAPEPRVEPYLAYAWALQEEHRLDEAEVQIRRALEIDPNSAKALSDLGGLHEERGDFAEAEASFRAAIAADPSYPAPRARLAQLLLGRLPDADFDALRAMLDDPELDPDARCRLQYAEGAVLDARGDYDAAAVCFRLANTRATLAANGPLRYDITMRRHFFEDIRRAFSPEFFRRTAGGGLPTRCPVFIVGLPRSGTTLVEQVLASHPQVHGAGELPLARLMYGNLPSLLRIAEPSGACVGRLGPETIRGLSEAYLERLLAIAGRPVERIVDKMPHNFVHLGLLAALFPNATFIHCRRDLRDVALSCWMTDFRSLGWASDPKHIATEFQGYLDLMEHWRACLPVTLHEVHYEETVTDLEGVARRLIDSLGLEWDPACLEFHRARRAIRTASVRQARQPVYTRSVGRWQRYELTLADLFAALPVPPDEARRERRRA